MYWYMNIMLLSENILCILNSTCLCSYHLQSGVAVPNFPANEAKGTHTVPFSATIYIEQSDFREVWEKTIQLAKFLL